MDLVELAHGNLLGVFGERDPQARTEMIDRIYAPQVTFADPDEVVVGRDALNRKAQHLLDEAPDFVFSPAGPVRVVDDLAVLPWHFGPAGRPPVISGTDFLLAADGLITAVYTLLDSEPQGGRD